MRIEGMTVGGVPPFTKSIEFKFNEHVNLFIGPNASGKTTLLQEIVNYIARHDDPDVAQAPRIVIPATRVQYRGHSAPGPRMASYFRKGELDVGDGVIWGTKGLRDSLHGDEIQDITNFLYALLIGWDEDERDSFLNYCGNSLEGVSVQDAAENLRKAIDLSFQCAADICQNVLAPAGIIRDLQAYRTRSWQYMRPSDEVTVSESATESSLPSASAFVELGLRVPTWEVYADGSGKLWSNPVEPLHMAALSSGTGGTVWWSRWIALVLLWESIRQNQLVDWGTNPGFLIIDEIENHLHPDWQRRVIPALRKHFPGLQIFAATHSPFVVAGLEAGQVHLLKRDSNGTITTNPNERDIIGWTMDEISRTFMGIDDPTDYQTAQHAERLRQLRQKDSLTAEEVLELNNLRRLVNQDLLARGALNAQDERFDEMMRQYLNSRASDLSQDGV